ncbi:MAG: GlsB/YeaQ/YmgE family stress response membrane protein [Chloroflexota bacterium]
MLGVIVTLLIAGLVGWLADVIVPGRMPWGWLGAILAGLVGSWLGTALLGRMGPVIAGIPIIPALIGAIILALIVELVFKAGGRREV